MDSSVLIAWLRKMQTPQTEYLNRIVGHELVLLGDLILLEVLQGARSDADAAALERQLREFEIEPMVDVDMATKAARHFRALRALGITIRKQVDLLIGTFCIAHGHALLHADRDFDPMARHLGLRVAGAPDPLH